MRVLVTAVLAAAALFSGGCSIGASNGSAMTGPSSQTNVAMTSGGAAHRDGPAPIVDIDREPAIAIRADRGIPTPQPARDPAMMAIPVPQPPLPAPEPHHSAAHGYEARW